MDSKPPDRLCSSRKQTASLDQVNDQILEFKKKIQLLEGQRKALFENHEDAYKTNADRIIALKQTIANMVNDIEKHNGVIKSEDVADVQRRLNIQGSLPPIQNKNGDQAVELLDLNVIDLKKQRDVLEFRRTKKQQRLDALMNEYGQLIVKVDEFDSVKLPDLQHNNQRAIALENEVNRVEMQITQAKNVHKKYTSIKSDLIKDDTHMESELKRLDALIKKTEDDIAQVQSTKVCALKMRNTSFNHLQHEQKREMVATTTRRIHLSTMRQTFHERHEELKRLERVLAQNAHGIAHDSITPEPMSEPETEHDEENECDDDMRAMQAIFDKLKEITGAIATDDVLKRFKFQKETLTKLIELRVSADEEKTALEKLVEKINAKLDYYKYAADRDKEIYKTHLDTIEAEQACQHARVKSISARHEMNKHVSEAIQARLLQMCVLLKCMRDTETGETIESVEHNTATCDDLLRKFVKKILIAYNRGVLDTHVTDHINVGDELLLMEKLMRVCPEKKEHTITSKLIAIARKVVASSPRASDEEEEENVPTKEDIKRQAQMIIDVKVRRKNIKITLPY